jgi:hypothetical protein
MIHEQAMSTMFCDCSEPEIATTSTTIRSSSARTGFGYQARYGTTELVVEEDRIRAADGFREIWQFDFHPNRLSQRRAAQK